jgi:Skp family chaperone for outer membrane proteins
MKVFRMVLTTTLFSVFIVAAQAQVRSAVNPGSVPTTTTAPAAANLFAVIDSAAFSDEKGGIARVLAAMNQMDQKVEPLRKEIANLQNQLNAMQADIQKKQATESQAVLARMTDQAATLELQIKRKKEDGQGQVQREQDAVLEPLQADIANSLNAFAQSRGILMIIDSSRVPVTYVHATIDITKDFIAEYNRTHPVAGAAPAATPVKP